MRRIDKRTSNGFTIVELLVVIVVIGVLAGISIVGYTGISRRATEVSLKADLTSASQQLKMFHVDNNKYPATISCVVADSSTNKCIRQTPGNSFSYVVDNGTNPQTFLLVSNTSGIYYGITDNSALESYIPVVASGGSVLDANGFRTHTFTSSGTFTVTTGGQAEVFISGAGGGGSGDSYYCDSGPGGGGGLSRITYGAATFTANGGAGGQSCNINGSLGTTSISGGFTNTANPATGGGAVGGAVGGWDDEDQETAAGGAGGAGGKVVGLLTVVDSSTVTITVGSGGTGSVGIGYYGNSGGNGANGIVTIRYPH